MLLAERRSVMRLALAAIPSALTLRAARGEPPQVDPTGGVRVEAGQDRENKAHAIGVSKTSYKVLTRETGGALFVMEQSNHKKGGPSRHLHHNEDELFYALEGEYVVEVGGDLVHLRAGDCVLGPRGVPHAWAFVGDTQGRLLISFAPAGKMEAFFDARERLGIKPGTYASDANGAALLHAFGMELTGPPLTL